MNHTYIFYVRVKADIFEEREVYTDMLYRLKTQSDIRDTYKGINPVKVWEKVNKLLRCPEKAEKITGINKSMINEDSNTLRGMAVRSQMNPDIHGPYIVHSETELTFELMDTIMKNKSIEELREFLSSADTHGGE